MRNDEEPTPDAKPTLQDLIRKGREAGDRVKRGSKESLMGRLDQAEVLFLARLHHDLSTDQYIQVASQIGIHNKTDAFDLVKLHPHRSAIIARCFAEEEQGVARGQSYEYPGWKTALSWFKPPKPKKEKAAADDGDGAETTAVAHRLAVEKAEVSEKLKAAEQRERSERMAKEELAERAERLQRELDAARARIAELELQLAAAGKPAPDVEAPGEAEGVVTEAAPAPKPKRKPRKPTVADIGESR